MEDLPDETEVCFAYPVATGARPLICCVQDIELIHSRLNSTSISKLGLPRFGGHLKRLCLRQNFISHLDPDIFGALEKMEDLDFYDNKIKHVGSALNNMSNLT